MSVNQKIKRARLKMFRKDIGLMLFGACSYKFNWVVTPMPEMVEGGVRFDITTNNVEDGNIYINEHYINKTDYDHDNLVALIIHEILHILQKHGQRRNNRTPMLWNFACDHVVDRDLRSFALHPYQKQFNIIEELHLINPKCSAEEAYEWIINQEGRFTIGPGDGNDGDDDNRIEVSIITDEKTNERYIVTSPPDQNESLSQEDKEKLKQKIDQFISEARAQNQIMKEKGSNPGRIQEYLDRLLKVEIDWTSLLEKAIKTNIILKPNERNWRRLHPYYQLHGLNLPGRSMEEEKENIGQLVLLIDTSGSINKNDLGRFAYVLDKSLNYFDSVLLITHDTQIHQKVEFRKLEHTEVHDFIKNQGFEGRGGTSHRDCFKYIEDEIWSINEKRDVLSMVISLTDGYSDIDNIVNQFNWIKNNTPLVIASTSDWEFKNPMFSNISTIFIK